MNFVKVTFHDIDFWNNFQECFLRNDLKHFIHDDPEQCRKLVAAFVYVEHIKRSVLLEREFEHSTYDYLLSGIKVEYCNTPPEQTHQDIQWAVDVRQNYAWQL